MFHLLQLRSFISPKEQRGVILFDSKHLMKRTMSATARYLDVLIYGGMLRQQPNLRMIDQTTQFIGLIGRGPFFKSEFQLCFRYIIGGIGEGKPAIRSGTDGNASGMILVQMRQQHLGHLLRIESDRSNVLMQLQFTTHKEPQSGIQQQQVPIGLYEKGLDFDQQTSGRTILQYILLWIEGHKLLHLIDGKTAFG